MPSKYVIVNKPIGETPLEVLEHFRAEQISSGHREFNGIPMTYAGRLDPMAEGELLILIGDECKNKDRYLGLDKEYEVEVLFGIETDSYDLLGIAKEKGKGKKGKDVAEIDLQKYVGKFMQEYPPYSSKTFNGKQLHELARSNELPDEMPIKEVEIYSIEKQGERTTSSTYLLTYIESKIKLVKGDFRQEEILKTWREVLSAPNEFQMIKLKVKCSSGTYMRSLANKIGNDSGMGAIALSIKRTKIFL